MSEYLDKLKEEIANFPTDATDQNIITSVIINEYNKNKLMLDTTYRASTLIMTDVVSAITLITDENYATMMNNFSDLIAIAKKTKDFEFKIDPSVDVTDDMTTEEQIRFLAAVPQSMFDTIQIIKYYKPDYAIDMPNAMAASLNNSIVSAKVTALKGLMGSLYTNILSPFIEYQTYLDSNEIRKMIDVLANAEMFLIPKYAAPDNFMNGSGVLYSTYYNNNYKIASNGKIQLSKLITDQGTLSQFHNLLECLDEYMS